MNKVLHAEDGFIIGIEQGFLKVKSSKSQVNVEKSVNDFKLIRRFALQYSIKRLMIAIIETQEIPDNYSELFNDKLLESDLAFFYDVKIALVSTKKHFKMFQLHMQYAKSLNVDIEIFQTMKEAKVWLEIR